MKAFIKVMKALSDPNRVKMVKMLQRREMCVCEIQQALGLAQSTVSKHLRVLEETGLVTFRKDGLWVNYRAADGRESPYAAALLAGLEHWLEEDDQVAPLLARMDDFRRETICRN